MPDVDELQQAPARRVRTLTKRSRDPRPPGPRVSSNSSAIARMIAMPRPPSVRFSRSPMSPLFARVEALAVVVHLDHEPVAVQLVGDLDRALALAVRVPDGVRRRLGERELEVGHELLGDRPQAREPRQREPAERDVLGARRNRQSDDAPLRRLHLRQGLGRVLRDRHLNAAALPADLSSVNLHVPTPIADGLPCLLSRFCLPVAAGIKPDNTYPSRLSERVSVFPWKRPRLVGAPAAAAA